MQHNMFEPIEFEGFYEALTRVLCYLDIFTFTKKNLRIYNVPLGKVQPVQTSCVFNGIVEQFDVMIRLL
jgi:hypothetical protein